MFEFLTAVALLCIFNRHPVKIFKESKFYSLELIAQLHHKTYDQWTNLFFLFQQN